MTYRILMTVAAVLVALGPACDSDSASSVEDAGGDASESETVDEGDEKADEGDRKQGAEGGEKGSEGRPSARADESATLHEDPPPRIDALVEADDVESLAGGGSFEPAELPGRDPSPSYNARRFKPEDGSGYGAGIQLWAFDDAEAAQKRLKEFRAQYLDTGSIREDYRKILGASAFVSTRGGIHNILFSVDRPARVAAVSCSVEMCEKRELFFEFAAEVRERLADMEVSESNGSSN